MKARYKDQQGMAVIALLLLLFIAFGTMIIFLKQTITMDKRLVNHIKSYHCIQHFHTLLSEHIKDIERVNTYIISSDLSAAILTFFPGMQGAALSARKIKKLLKLLQYYEVISYEKNVIDLIKKGCPLSLTSPISPYTTIGFKINRSLSETAIVRKKKWFSIYILPLKRVIKVDYQVSGQELSKFSTAIW